MWWGCDHVPQHPPDWEVPELFPRGVSALVVLLFARGAVRAVLVRTRAALWGGLGVLVTEGL